jgi:exodeoxyribonuclease V
MISPRPISPEAVNLSPQQDDALLAVSRWLKSGRPQVFRLFGYAGTGKTTLARRIAEEVEGDVLFASFTGKAAQVMRNKGCANARTLHSLIYRPRGEKAEDETGELQPAFALNRASSVANAKLVIVDECSMVDEELGRDLLSFGTPVLVLGDPGQLPPVKSGQGGAGFFTEHEPDIMLTEVHRQARDNPIIALAQTVREGGRLQPGSHGESRVIARGEIDADQVLSADQVLVGRNRTRQLYNSRIRALRGFEGQLPASGDKLVCLRNSSEKGLLNGGLWRVSSVGTRAGPALNMLVKSEEEGPHGVSAKIRVLKAMFEDGPEALSWQQRRNSDEFDYGYALTVHKAQGSQWDRLVLFDESFAFRETRERWLYTAITRAAEAITIVQ